MHAVHMLCNFCVSRIRKKKTFTIINFECKEEKQIKRKVRRKRVHDEKKHRIGFCFRQICIMNAFAYTMCTNIHNILSEWVCVCVCAKQCKRSHHTFNTQTIYICVSCVISFFFLLQNGTQTHTQHNKIQHYQIAMLLCYLCEHFFSFCAYSFAEWNGFFSFNFYLFFHFVSF